MAVDISIIIPVYNTGEYLYESLDSIFAQTFDCFELLCIDDCSDDILTLDILSQYENEHTNMRVIHMEQNKGAAEARNEGLRQAEGRYVIFLDADDIFSEDLLVDTYQAIKSSNSDVCICGYSSFRDTIKHTIKDYNTTICSKEDDGAFNVTTMGEGVLGILGTCPWKLCSKQFLIDNNIIFQSLPSCNDVFFSVSALIKARKIICTNSGKSYIFYRVGTDNQISNRRDPFNLWYAIQKLLDEFQNDMSFNYIKEIYLLWMECSIYELRMCRNQIIREQYCIFISKYLKEQVDQSIFVNDRNKILYEYFIAFDNTLQWFERDTFFLIQMEYRKRELLIYLSGGESIIILWGNGMRGKAFQRFCKKNDIQDVLITDKCNENIGNKTEEGFLIISTKEALEMGDLIVASNEIIYNNIKDQCKLYRKRCINLELFSAFSV